jgi:hypothetical protein
MANPIIDTMMDGLKESEKTFQKEILDSKDDFLNSIPESVFVNLFLPYFSGEDRELEKNNTVVNWISIAGTPMKEVKVVSDTTGELLFKVPSIYDTSIIDVTRKDNENSYSEIALGTDMNSRNIKSSGDKYFAEEMSKKIDNMASNGNVVSESTVVWNSILSRYGKKPIIENTSENKVPATNDNLDEYFE